MSYNIQGSMIKGKLSMDDNEKYFVDRFNAYISPCKQHFTESNKTNSTQIGTSVQTPVLTTHNELGINVMMSKSQFKNLCELLQNLEEEEKLRYSDDRLYRLWIEYKTWYNLIR